MIALVEGAERQKTPNEIALNILIAGLTLIFLLAVVTLHPYAVFSVNQSGTGTVPTVTVLVSLLVCLIPTTIGGLLSAIGIAGMDRVMQFWRLAARRLKRQEMSTLSCWTKPEPLRSGIGRLSNFSP
jgi:high-affinity K+ transport system ATPase subunit B